MAADTSGILGAQRSHTQVARPSPRTVPRTHLPDHRSIDQATTRTRRSSASIEWPADTWLGQMRKNERADVTTDGQVSLSNGTLQRKRTLPRALAPVYHFGTACGITVSDAQEGIRAE
jgi:hypothetical protein